MADTHSTSRHTHRYTHRQTDQDRYTVTWGQKTHTLIQTNTYRYTHIHAGADRDTQIRTDKNTHTHTETQKTGIHRYIQIQTYTDRCRNTITQIEIKSAR